MKNYIVNNFKAINSQYAVGQLSTCIDLEGCSLEATMFEKYPSISPYTYCANNPMKYVDPTGETLRFGTTDANEAFKSLLTSFKGVNEDNYKNVFFMNSKIEFNNLYNSRYGITKQDFKDNYFNITGEKIKGKNLKNAYNIYKAMSSLKTVEIEAAQDGGTDFVYKASTQKRTQFKDLPDYEDSKNNNLNYKTFWNAKSFGDEFNKNKKLLFIPNTESKYEIGTFIINGNVVNSISEKKKIILNIINNYDFNE